MVCSMQMVCIVVILLLIPISAGARTDSDAIALEAELQKACARNPPEFSSFIPSLPPFGRRLRVAAPCTGIHGCGHALQHMCQAADSCLIYDLEPRYHGYLMSHLLDMGMHLEDISLHLGKTAGDLLKLPLSAITGHIDILCAGPPCPPWSGQSNRKSLKDVRSKVFLRILEWTIYMIKCCGSS